MTIHCVVPDISSAVLGQSRQFYQRLGLVEVMNLGWVITLASPSHPTAQVTLMGPDATAAIQPDVTIEVDDVDAVASGIRCKSASAGSDFMGRLCGGSDSFWLIIGLGCCDGAWPQLTGWFEQRAAQVLQEPQAIWGHGQAAPAAGGPVEHGPDQGEAAGLAGQPADDLDPAAG